MTFAGTLCYYVCACLRACVVVPMRMCANVDGLFVLGFSHLVCLYVSLCVCVGGGGCMDRCVGEGVFVRECLKVCDCILWFLVA